MVNKYRVPRRLRMSQKKVADQQEFLSAINARHKKAAATGISATGPADRPYHLTFPAVPQPVVTQWGEAPCAIYRLVITQCEAAAAA